MTDIKPLPPEKPLASDCCESGCERCVYDIYAEELEMYESKLVEWKARQVLDPPVDASQSQAH